MVLGFTGTKDMSETSKWWEKQVYAVFVRHKLLRIEHRNTGSRVYTITERGLDFSAWIDHKTEA
jgi:hypothetical protein